MNHPIRNLLSKQSGRLFAIRDTPEAIAGGVAIGLFFGFTPLIGLQTLLSIFFAWLFRFNLIAAAVAVTLHDVTLPFIPFVYRWEYDIGYWLLHQPHQWPPSITHLRLHGHEWRSWTTFFTVGRPLLVGSVVVATPVAVATFLITRTLVRRHWKREQSLKSLPSDGST